MHLRCHHIIDHVAALQDVRSTQLCMVVLPNQLVDPVLSLSNVLQKAMHVRFHHHVAASLQDVRSTQLSMVLRPNQLVDPVLSLSNVWGQFWQMFQMQK